MMKKTEAALGQCVAHMGNLTDDMFEHYLCSTYGRIIDGEFKQECN